MVGELYIYLPMRSTVIESITSPAGHTLVLFKRSSVSSATFPDRNLLVSLVNARFGCNTLSNILANIMSNPNVSYGERLLPRVLDDYAEFEPERLYASIPRLVTDLSRGFRDITAKDMAHCVDVLAYHLERFYGRGYNFGTICYLGPPDLRGAMIFFAAVKCGYKVKANCQQWKKLPKS